ncbi:MAG TPA: AAA family ATPase [Anaerolineae bacterium]|nr:AAA family ATPase [Anaerolineae bacterium]
MGLSSRLTPWIDYATMPSDADERERIVTKTIAVAGKGGTGKTTISALIIDYLARNRKGSVLAIDADPSTNLNLALGVPLTDTVGDVREETATAAGGGRATGGMSKWDYLDLRINQALVEERGFDLLAMGRPEGPGCYCAANNILRVSVDRLSAAYDYVVIDNEAGLEHLSRRTTRDVDVLFLVSDPTLRGLVAAARVADIVDELKTSVGSVFLIVNRVQGDMLPDSLAAYIGERNLRLAGLIPADPLVAELDARGEAIVRLPPDAPSRIALEYILDRAEAGL